MKKHFKHPEAAITDKMLNQLKCCYICYISKITLTVNMSNKSQDIYQNIYISFKLREETVFWFILFCKRNLRKIFFSIFNRPDSYSWPVRTPGPACFHAAGHNILGLFIDKSFLASISGQTGVFLVDCLSFISKTKKIINVCALIFSLL